MHPGAIQGQQTVHPNCCSLLRTGLLQSALPPAWRQSFPSWADSEKHQRECAPRGGTDWRTKILNAVDRSMPSSPKSASACAFKSESIRMLMFVVEPAIKPSPFLLMNIVYVVCTKKSILCTNNLQKFSRRWKTH